MNHCKALGLSSAFYVACAAIPVVLLLACLVLVGEYPFGSIRMLGGDYDLAYQYANLLSWFQSTLLGDASLLYSQGKSLGGNMFATYSYYVASPLNLLLAFFPRGAIEDFYFFVRLLRTALCSFAIAFYLQRRLPTLARPMVLALAVCYALCAYNLVQAANIMWLDAPILLPLIALGVWRFVTDGRLKLFVVALAVAIWSCWYTGYMLVVASVFIFVLEYFLQANDAEGKSSWRAFAGKLVKFGLVLLLIAAAAAAILAPSVYALLSGKGDQFATASPIIRCWPWDFFASVLPFSLKYNWKGPQLFCGTFTVGAVFLLFFTKKISRKNKITLIVFLFALLLCMIASPLERVWTCFTDGNNYYCRWGFVVQFYMLLIAAIVLSKGLPERNDVLRALVCLVVLGIIGFLLDGFNSFEAKYPLSLVNSGQVENEFIVDCFAFFSKPVCFAIFLVVCAALVGAWLLAKRGKALSGQRANWVAATVLVVIVSAEMGINAFASIAVDEAVGRNVYSGEFTQYNAESAESLATLQASDPGLYRVDKTYTCLQDHTRLRVPTSESLALGYMPLCSYLSTNDTGVSAFLGNLGYMARQSDAADIIQDSYCEPILPSDSLLGLRYVATGDALYGYQATGITSGKRTSEESETEHYWYKNEDAFPLAFGVGSTATQSIGAQSDAFTYQNKLFQALFGTDQEMYSTLQSTKAQSDSSGIYWRADESSASDLCYVEVRSTRDYRTCYWDGFNLNINGNAVAGGYYRAFSYGIVPAGAITAGEEISLTGSTGIGDDEAMTLYLVQANKGFLDSCSQQANAKAATFNEFRDGYISASYTAGAEDAYLFMSVPYDAGWTVKVNGEVVQPETVGDCLMAIPVTQGENNVELSYCSPMLMQGAAVSIAAWLGILAFMAVRALRKRATK